MVAIEAGVLAAKARDESRAQGLPPGARLTRKTPGGPDTLLAQLIARRSFREPFKRTLTADFVANLIRNVWSYAIIFCGHFPDQTYTFTQEETADESKGAWYVRQLLGAANIDGGPMFHVISGNLGYQVEHHLYPDMPSTRYGRSPPRCARSASATTCPTTRPVLPAAGDGPAHDPAPGPPGRQAPAQARSLPGPALPRTGRAQRPQPQSCLVLPRWPGRSGATGPPSVSAGPPWLPGPGEPRPLRPRNLGHAAASPVRGGSHDAPAVFEAPPPRPPPPPDSPWENTAAGSARTPTGAARAGAKARRSPLGGRAGARPRPAQWRTRRRPPAPEEQTAATAVHGHLDDPGVPGHPQRQLDIHV